MFRHLGTQQFCFQASGLMDLQPGDLIGTSPPAGSKQFCFQLSGFIDLQVGGLLGTFSPLVRIPLSALQDSSMDRLSPPTTASVHALHNSIPSSRHRASLLSLVLETPALPLQLLARINVKQRTSFLYLWGTFIAFTRSVRPQRSRNLNGPGRIHRRYFDIKAIFFCAFPNVFSTVSDMLTRPRSRQFSLPLPREDRWVLHQSLCTKTSCN